MGLLLIMSDYSPQCRTGDVERSRDCVLRLSFCNLEQSRDLRSSGTLTGGLLTCEDGTDTLSRNVGKQLPHDAA